MAENRKRQEEREPTEQHWFRSAISGRPAKAFRDHSGQVFIDDGREARLSRLQGPEILRLAAEVDRLSSPEAAWETVRDFMTGAARMAEWQFREVMLPHYRQDFHYVERQWTPFQRNPWAYCADRSPEAPGRALFAECLRLGRTKE